MFLVFADKAYFLSVVLLDHYAFVWKEFALRSLRVFFSQVGLVTLSVVFHCSEFIEWLLGVVVIEALDNVGENVLRIFSVCLVNVCK